MSARELFASALQESNSSELDEYSEEELAAFGVRDYRAEFRDIDFANLGFDEIQEAINRKLLEVREKARPRASQYSMIHLDKKNLRQTALWLKYGKYIELPDERTREEAKRAKSLKDFVAVQQLKFHARSMLLTNRRNELKSRAVEELPQKIRHQLKVKKQNHPEALDLMLNDNIPVAMPPRPAYRMHYVSEWIAGNSIVDNPDREIWRNGDKLKAVRFIRRNKQQQEQEQSENEN